MQEYKVGKNTIYYHKGDLPNDVSFKDSIAVDTEMTGLSLLRDRVCVIQLSGGDGTAHVIKIDKENPNCPNVKKLLTNKNIVKIFHYARQDMAMLKKTLGIDVAPIYCTKIASRLVRTYSPNHGYKVICEELLENVEISKTQTQTDWANDQLTKKQIEYAAADVFHLHEVKNILDRMLMREGRMELADNCFKFLKTRVELDLSGFAEVDIFVHTA